MTVSIVRVLTNARGRPHTDRKEFSLKIALVAARSLKGSGFATRIDAMLHAYVGEGFEIDFIHLCFEHESQISPDAVPDLVNYVPVGLHAAPLRQHLSATPPLAWHCARTRSVPTPGEKYDVVQAETSATWAVARGLPASRRVVVFHDDDGVRLHRLASDAPTLSRKLLTSVSASKYERWQQRVLGEADEAWFASSIDRDRLVASPQVETRVVPNGAHDGLWSVSQPAEGSSSVVLFVGPAAYEANRSGLSWFMDRVWPLVREKRRSVELRVIGEGWGGTRTSSGITFRGFEPVLEHAYEEASVVVAPLLSGGGTKIKVIEGMAAGRPVVSTTVGAEGIPPSPGLKVSDDAGVFAAYVADYLSDLEAARSAGRENRKAVDDLRWSKIWEDAAHHLVSRVGASR